MIKLRKKLNILRSIILKKPVFCILRPTIACNYNCLMCNVQEYEPDIPPISLEEVKEVALRLKKLGVAIVNLGGGEPLLHPDIVAITAYLAKYFSVRIQTNGSLATPELVKELVKAGLDGVSVTFHSLDPAINEKLTGNKFAFDNGIKALYYFASFMPLRGKLIILNSVITKYNYQELARLHSLARFLGYKIAFIPLLSTDSEEENHPFKKYVPFLNLNQDEKAKVIDFYERLLQLRNFNGLASSKSFLQDCREYYRTGKRNWRCWAGDLFILVNPRAELSICSEFPPLGSILDDDFFKKFLHSPSNFGIKKMIQSCSDCMHPCFAEISLLTRLRYLIYRSFEDLHLALSPRHKPPPLEEIFKFVESLRLQSQP